MAPEDALSAKIKQLVSSTPGQEWVSHWTQERKAQRMTVQFEIDSADAWVYAGLHALVAWDAENHVDDAWLAFVLEMLVDQFDAWASGCGYAATEQAMRKLAAIIEDCKSDGRWVAEPAEETQRDGS
ncbi:MAG: hypothetical protein KDD83_08690 [Caldilineaceae bacterium]|nr:hypothetical protein [Caldilineaceae bacterium]